MPRIADPSGLRSRPTSVALGELAIAAGLVGESITIACDFPANTLCQVWKYYAQAVGFGNVMHIRTRRDIKDLAQRITGTRAVFVSTPRCYREAAWSIQMAESNVMSPRPAIFCGFRHDDPDSDPGLTLSLTNDEEEVATVLAWAADESDRQIVEIETPSSVDYDSQLASLLNPSTLEVLGLSFHETRIARALVEGVAVLRSAADQDSDAIETTLTDYGFARALLCSPIVRPNRELCEPLALDMVSCANVYLSVKLGGNRNNPFRVDSESGHRRSRSGSLKRDAITRRELADLGNVHSRMISTLIEFLQSADSGYAQYVQMGCSGEPIQERNWRRESVRELARRLNSWLTKQVRTHFDRLTQRGLITVQRERANGPLRYEIPEEFGNVQSLYSRLPTADAHAQRS